MVKVTSNQLSSLYKDASEVFEELHKPGNPARLAEVGVPVLYIDCRMRRVIAFLKALSEEPIAVTLTLRT
jgi:hypothetical protein